MKTWRVAVDAEQSAAAAAESGSEPTEYWKRNLDEADHVSVFFGLKIDDVFVDDDDFDVVEMFAPNVSNRTNDQSPEFHRWVLHDHQ